MTEAIIILLNMRGGCATVGDKVHALFRVNGRGRARQNDPHHPSDKCENAANENVANGTDRPSSATRSVTV
jgi:hypothetical protein